MAKRKRTKKMKVDEGAFQVALQREFDLTGGKIGEATLISRLARSTFGLSKSDRESRTLIRRQLSKFLKDAKIKKIVTTAGGVYWAPIAPGEEAIVLLSSRDKTKAVDSAPTWPAIKSLETARKLIARTEQVLRDFFADIVSGDVDWLGALPPITKSQLRTLYAKTHGAVPSEPTPEEVFSVAGIHDFFHILKERGWQLRYRSRMQKLPADLRPMVSKLKELAEYRNRIQHNEKLSEIELINFVSSAWLTVIYLESVTRYRGNRV